MSNDRKNISNVQNFFGESEGIVLFGGSVSLMENNEFSKWMKRVDQFLWDSFGFVSSDLPDCDYWDWYEEGNKPEFAALMAIEEAGGFA